MIYRVINGIFLFAALATVASPAYARPQRVINDNDTVILRGNVHPHARPEFDVGAADYSLPMERMILSLRIRADKKSELDKFLAEQQDPDSHNYHKWLTPEEFGERFGADADDVEAATSWLKAHGFTINEVAKGRTWINFSGTVAGVESTFHTKIRDYKVNGRVHHANAQDPSIPRGLSDLVAGIVTLHNFPRKFMNSGARSLEADGLQPDYSSGSGNHYLAPGDFATIYDVNTLYGGGTDGTGQAIAIVGRTNPGNNISNWTTFRSLMGLPVNTPTVIVNGTNPGDQGYDEDNEADLDVEWSGAVAKNATISFVASMSTNNTDGVDLSAQYIVNNNIAPVMSTSFGSCESDMGTAENNFYNSLWQQAAAQGITAFVSSGDSGASGCDSGGASKGTGRAVNGLASTPYNVAVGGTQFNEGSGSYWSSSNGAGYTSALSYIPEVAWNESGAASSCPSGDTCSELWSTGGGVSSIYSKPSWQVAPGVPPDSKRDVPDVSLTAAGHDGYLVYTTALNSNNQPYTGLWVFGGTSCSSPSFAGLMALIVQKTGQRQGNANIRLYQLGKAQYGSNGAAVFHDVTSGNNSVPGVTGYSCSTGYDLATGLGSVDANTLVNNWTAGVTTVAITSPSNNAIYAPSVTINISATATAITPFTINKVEFYNGTSLLGTSVSPPYVYNWQNVPAGAYSINALAYDSLGGKSPSASVTVFVSSHTSNILDFNGDGKKDILWQNTVTGELAVWFMNGINMTNVAMLNPSKPVESNWNLVDTGDFNGDGKTDILWQNSVTGDLVVWYMNGINLTGIATLNPINAGAGNTTWKAIAVGNFGGPSGNDILWQNSVTEDLVVWQMYGVNMIDVVPLIPSKPGAPNWKFVGLGDFNNDGNTDILWQNSVTYDLAIWYMNGTSMTGAVLLNPQNSGAGSNWKAVAVGDYNNDGKPDILWQNSSTGDAVVWLMDGINMTNVVPLNPINANNPGWVIKK